MFQVRDFVGFHHSAGAASRRKSSIAWSLADPKGLFLHVTGTLKRNRGNWDIVVPIVFHYMSLLLCACCIFLLSTHLCPAALSNPIAGAASMSRLPRGASAFAQYGLMDSHTCMSF